MRHSGEWLMTPLHIGMIFMMIIAKTRLAQAEQASCERTEGNKCLGNSDEIGLIRLGQVPTPAMPAGQLEDRDAKVKVTSSDDLQPLSSGHKLSGPLSRVPGEKLPEAPPSRNKMSETYKALLRQGAMDTTNSSSGIAHCLDSSMTCKLHSGWGANPPSIAESICNLYDLQHPANHGTSTLTSWEQADLWNRAQYEPLGYVDPIAFIIYNAIKTNVMYCHSNHGYNHGLDEVSLGMNVIGEALLDWYAQGHHTWAQIEEHYPGLQNIATKMDLQACHCCPDANGDCHNVQGQAHASLAPTKTPTSAPTRAPTRAPTPPR
eukprot:gnl/TRDRNA2_/TRDRNA2_36659_c0_seq1.p1 gnl/TRDRNA2_/TRDRNA2_36659_c0~~gnl/TRDRNA2_/TRDRNA2_36659_c0_seq1.p1  ORF type:complete len:319 (+),score=26.06 gnl/TRDRNA2_/TRDRNA2_36659_c0_seq1:57-1013(+)